MLCLFYNLSCVMYLGYNHCYTNVYDILIVLVQAIMITML